PRGPASPLFPYTTLFRSPDDAEKGAVVEVRFGNARRRGVVTEIGVEAPAGVEAAPVDRVAERVPPALVDLALWLADYYGSTPARDRKSTRLNSSHRTSSY